MTMKTIKTLYEKIGIIRKDIILPLLPGLTIQTGLLHTVHYHVDWKYLFINSERSGGIGFWSDLGRFLGIDREVIRIQFNGQMWTCRYYQPLYFLTAEQIREKYYDKLRESLGGYDFVVIGK